MEKKVDSEVEVLFICLNFNITLNFFYFCTSLYLAGGSEGSEGGGEVKVLQNTPRKQTNMFIFWNFNSFKNIFGNNF